MIWHIQPLVIIIIVITAAARTTFPNDNCFNISGHPHYLTMFFGFAFMKTGWPYRAHINPFKERAVSVLMLSFPQLKDMCSPARPLPHFSLEHNSKIYANSEKYGTRFVHFGTIKVLTELLLIAAVGHRLGWECFSSVLGEPGVIRLHSSYTRWSILVPVGCITYKSNPHLSCERTRSIHYT